MHVYSDISLIVVSGAYSQVSMVRFAARLFSYMYYCTVESKYAVSSFDSGSCKVWQDGNRKVLFSYLEILATYLLLSESAKVKYSATGC